MTDIIIGNNNKNSSEIITSASELVLGENTKSKIYTHSVFCQCILPIRSVKKRHYSVNHGNASLSFFAGSFQDPQTKEIFEQEIPAGPKARLLFSYIIDQAKRSGTPRIDMGSNLYQFMINNNIPVGGTNAKELTKQVRNIAAADISIGLWGETETHHYNHRGQFKIAEEVSFWLKKDPTLPQLWEPYLTLSDKFMAALESHSVLLELAPLIQLQNNARAMDMYMWLSYRTANMKHSVKISYEDLHSIFGQQTKELRSFKQEFKRALQLAAPYVTTAQVDLDSDSKHIILSNPKHQIYLPNGKIMAIEAAEEGVFGELQSIGLAQPRIKKLIKEKDEASIKKALDLTKSNIKKGTVKNPPAYFTKALEENWEDSVKPVEEKAESTLDIDYEKNIKPATWRKVREALVQKYGVPTFNSWFKDLKYLRQEENYALLEVSTRFIKDYVEGKYLETIIRIWHELNEDIETVKLEVRKNNKK